MSKVAIITDSNSGITQAQGKEMGIFVLPMPFFINEETFYEDISLTQEQFYEKLRGGAEIHTSQPSPESVMQLWDEVLKDYDEIVHIPMSSGLSGSCQSAVMLAQDYAGKVQVVNNQRISVTQRQSALDAKLLASKGMNALEIKNFLEEDKFNSSIYIMLDTLYYLKKGGRITPAAAALGTLLKLKPVLCFCHNLPHPYQNFYLKSKMNSDKPPGNITFPAVLCIFSCILPFCLCTL